MTAEQQDHFAFSLPSLRNYNIQIWIFAPHCLYSSDFYIVLSCPISSSVEIRYAKFCQALPFPIWM